MQLTLSEAARLLGKSDRQVRYMIRQGKLPATKHGDRWVLASDDLPVDDARLRAQERKAEEFQELASAALPPRVRPKRYSVRSLHAFQHLTEIARALEQSDGSRAALEPVIEATVEVARGCHEFHDDAKRSAFGRAREAASRAVALLYVATDSAAEALAQRLEEDVLPSLAGLLRRQERRKTA